MNGEPNRGRGNSAELDAEARRAVAPDGVGDHLLSDSSAELGLRLGEVSIEPEREHQSHPEAGMQAELRAPSRDGDRRRGQHRDTANPVTPTINLPLRFILAFRCSTARQRLHMARSRTVTRTDIDHDERRRRGRRAGAHDAVTADPEGRVR